MKNLKRFWLFFLISVVMSLFLSIIVTIITTIFFPNVDVFWNNLAYIWFIALIYWFWWAFLSLLLSRWMAKFAYWVDVIAPEEIYQHEDKVKKSYELIERLSQSNNIKTPEFGIFSNTEVNAFATWPSKNRSLIAISSQMLVEMDQDEIDGVIWHEFAHIINGDMVWMTIISGLMNACVIFIARILTNIIDSATGNKLWEIGKFFLYMGVQIALSLPALLIVNKYSRYREYHADAGSAQLVWKDKMIKGLKKLQLIYNRGKKEWLNQTKTGALANLSITNDNKDSIWSTHPSLDNRINALIYDEYIKTNF